MVGGNAYMLSDMAPVRGLSLRSIPLQVPPWIGE
jgi:hypothetical protein